MKQFNSLDDIKQYYNVNTDTYEFIENGEFIDIYINFNLYIESNIKACNIYAKDIKAGNIKSGNINSKNINSGNINALNIKSWNINAGDIKAWNIKAWDINAGNIKAWNINAKDINAYDINAYDINALDIKFYSVCFSRKNFICNSIKGIRENSKYFCLDSDVVINSKKCI